MSGEGRREGGRKVERRDTERERGDRREESGERREGGREGGGEKGLRERGREIERDRGRYTHGSECPLRPFRGQSYPTESMSAQV